MGITLLAGALLLGIGMARRAAHDGSPVARAGTPARLATAAFEHAGLRVTARRRLVSRAGIKAAQRFARRRQGQIAFAAIERGDRPRGLLRTTQFPSASISKAMLLVAYLRRAGNGRLTDSERLLLQPMIVVSDNDAADAVFAQVGAAGLLGVARAAGMRKFIEVGHWSNEQITAADQARFFLRIDQLVPAVHRRYERKLLSSIVSEQRWGIPAAARRHRLKAFFKGGWRAGIVHQAALLQQTRGGRRLALAVLTSGTPSTAYGEETIEGIADRLLRRR